MLLDHIKKPRPFSLFLVVFLLVFFTWQPISMINTPKAQATIQSFVTSGSWVAPTGVTSVLVEAWGGGGAGGGRGASTGQSGGGGGGAFASATISVTPGNSYAYTVGAAVAGGNGNGTNGNLSQWVIGADVRAAGGSGGLGTTTGGLGGTVAASVGTATFKGGDGADGGAVSGGGGGGGGTTGAGGNATAGTAGTGTTIGGGAGGAGVANANGNPGVAAGGGGSGARRTNGNRSGGGGAAGQITITYNTAPVFTVNTTDSPDPVNYGSNVTFAATATDNEHSWKLVVCKTDSVTPGTNPACAGGQSVCVSSSATASGVSNSCVWASDQTTSLTWYSYACDNTATMPTCTTANTNNSPLVINVVISVAITTDGTISYGTLNSNESKSTIDLSDTQTARNDTNIAEDFNIKTSAPLGWSVGLSTAPDTFVHEFSTNGGGVWTKFTTAESYQSLATNILPNATQNFDLRFTSPNPSTSSTQKSIDVTIQAVQH